MNTVLAINAPTFVMKIASLLSKSAGIYSYAIIIRVLLSWLPQPMQYNQYGQQVRSERPVYDFLRKITDPYMNFFRSRKLTVGRIDYSPLIALMVLNIVKSVFQIIGTYGRISLGLILAIVVNNMWSYLFSYVLFLIVALLAVRWFCGRKPYQVRNQQIMYNLDRILQKPVNFVFRIFYKNKQVADQTLVGFSLLFYLAVYITAKYGLQELINWLASLQ